MSKHVSFSLKAIAGAVLIVAAGSAMAAAEFGANIELDNTNRSGSAVAAGADGLSQSGRVEVGVSAKVGADAFVAAKTSFLSQKNGNLGTDDMWVQLGNQSGDVKLGRFEGADLFPLISDTLVNHAGSVYGTNTLRGRMGSDVFHAAGTLNLGGSNSLEIGYIDGTKSSVAAVGAKGLRAVASFGAGALSARIGVEQGEYASTNKVQGWGLTATYDAGSFKLTGNYSNGKQDAAANNNKSAYALSVGVGAFGAGYVAATNDQAGGDIKVNTAYAAYSIPLFGLKGASVTPAISSSTAKDSVTGASTSENAVRVRLNYAF
jgi:hypothetical protein